MGEHCSKNDAQNSYILNTKGQVYRKWFDAKSKEIDKVPKTLQNTTDAIEKALKAIDCFKACQQAPTVDTMNKLGFYSVVEVGCNFSN